MEAVLKQESEEIKQAWEELLQELDKGIRDLERGDVIPHDEMMRQIREKYGLNDV